MTQQEIEKLLLKYERFQGTLVLQNSTIGIIGIGKLKDHILHYLPHELLEKARIETDERKKLLILKNDDNYVPISTALIIDFIADQNAKGWEDRKVFE